jgi:hypothetical protein
MVYKYCSDRRISFFPLHVIRGMMTCTCSFSYLRLQVIRSRCLRVIGNHPRRTPTSHPHNSLNIEPIPSLIHRLTDKFLAHCPSHPNPPVQQIGNYTLADLTSSSSFSSIGTTTLSWVPACSTIVEHSQQEGFTECGTSNPQLGEEPGI